MGTRSLRVAIAGAGNVGRSIARELIDNGHSVTLLEREAKALKVATVPQATWLHADACELTSLEAADLQSYDVVVAATGDDKTNLVVSLLAKTEFGVNRVVARVNHPKNEWLFDAGWGVDVAVSTPRMLTAMVEEALSVGDLVRLMRFRQGEASLVEITLEDDSPVVGRTIGEIDMPDGTGIVAVLRDGRLVMPGPDVGLESGDEVLALVAEQLSEPALARTLGGERATTSLA